MAARTKSSVTTEFSTTNSTPRHRWRPADGISKLFSSPASKLSHPQADFYLVLGAASMLALVGVLMIWSASSVYASVNQLGPYYYLQRQIIFLAIGGPVAWGLSRCGTRTIYGVGFAGILVSVVLLLAVHTPLGVELYGNRAWLNVGPLGTIQPSEFAKVALVMWAAGFVALRKRTHNDPAKWVPQMVTVFGIIECLVLAQKDLGTMVVIGMILMAVLIFAEAPWKWLAWLTVAAVTGVLLMIATDAERRTRILSFLHPESAVSDQPNNAIYALASGGWLGLGLGRSRQKWGGLYNGAQTDYVFAVLGEETGLVGTLGVISLFLVLVFAGFRAASRCTSRSLGHAAAGMTAWLGLQALINIAVVLRVAPVLGIPLPFLSQGGSALLANLAGVGVILAAARREPGVSQSATTTPDKPQHTPRITSVVDTPGG